MWGAGGESLITETSYSLPHKPVSYVLTTQTKQRGINVTQLHSGALPFPPSVFRDGLWLVTSTPISLLKGKKEKKKLWPLSVQNISVHQLQCISPCSSGNVKSLTVSTVERCEKYGWWIVTISICWISNEVWKSNFLEVIEIHSGESYFLYQWGFCMQCKSLRTGLLAHHLLFMPL